MPIGDETFVQATLAKGVSKIEAKIEKITNQLQSCSAQGLYCVTSFCFLPLVQHHLQLSHPGVTASAARRLDDAILVATFISSGINMATADRITKARHALPKRMNGGAMRNQVKVSPAAFIGGLLMALSRMLDRMYLNGDVSKGFMNTLAPLLGLGSFDEGSEGTR